MWYFSCDNNNNNNIALYHSNTIYFNCGNFVLQIEGECLMGDAMYDFGRALWCGKSMALVTPNIKKKFCGLVNNLWNDSINQNVF